VLPLTPALLRRGLNCIGSASLKGASLAVSAPMIFASRGNFKRGRRGLGRVQVMAPAPAQPSHGIPCDFHQIAVGRPLSCRIGPSAWAAFGTRLGPTKSRTLAPSPPEPSVRTGLFYGVELESGRYWAYSKPMIFPSTP
jgi:hypothetical protein